MKEPKARDKLYATVFVLLVGEVFITAFFAAGGHLSPRLTPWVPWSMCGAILTIMVWVLDLIWIRSE